MITSIEVKHLLKYLGLNDEDYGYINIYTIQGIIKEEVYITFNDISNILSSLGSQIDFKLDKVLEELSFSIEEEEPNKAVLVSEFLELYESISRNSS